MANLKPGPLTGRAEGRMLSPNTYLRLKFIYIHDLACSA
ncbi:MAG: hypothetical protein JWQ14_55 [Adhaeribacter sp.]|nr:hypothetical protein [Adhaeribacter sp.]